MIANLVGVSVPRSGHHHLASLLQAALGDDLYHCEFYSTVACCREIPCTRAAARLRYQKNHDFDFALPADLAGVHYLIQVRDPVAAALSDRELFEATYGTALASDADHHVVWLAAKAVYLERFWDKWCRSPPLRSRRLDYEELLAQPEENLTALLSWIGMPVSPQQVQRAVDLRRGVRARGGGEPFAARSAEQSRHWSPDIYGVFADLVSFFEPAPQHPAKTVAATPAGRALTLIWAALRSSGEVALAAFELALAASPRNPFLREAHAWALLAAGHTAAAVATLEAERERVERHAGPCRTLGECRRRDGDLDGAIAAVRQAVALAPGLASHRVFLGSLLAEAGRRDEGADEARGALQEYLGDPRELLVTAHLLFAVSDWDAGLAALGRAIALGLPASEWWDLRQRVLALRGSRNEREDGAGPTGMRSLSLLLRWARRRRAVGRRRRERNRHDDGRPE